jgi:hypothetical protein
MKPIRAGAFPAPTQNSLPAPGKFPARAKKIPCAARKEIRGFACNVPEMQRELTPSIAESSGDLKKNPCQILCHREFEDQARSCRRASLDGIRTLEPPYWAPRAAADATIMATWSIDWR